MDAELKRKLEKAGRHNVVEMHELIQSGYAGVDKLGQIVDRRLPRYKDATPIAKNTIFGTPQPKSI